MDSGFQDWLFGPESDELEHIALKWFATEYQAAPQSALCQQFDSFMGGFKKGLEWALEQMEKTKGADE